VGIQDYDVPKGETSNPVRFNQVMEFTSDSAKKFLLSKLTEQAMHDGVVLDEIEKRMFLFSESSGSPDFDTQERFDKDYDSETYESKVT
jgi:hypothetical protein